MGLGLPWASRLLFVVALRCVLTKAVAVKGGCQPLADTLASRNSRQRTTQGLKTSGNINAFCDSTTCKLYVGLELRCTELGWRGGSAGASL